MEQVFITSERLEDLVKTERILHALHNAGVDNWHGYDEALDPYYERESEQWVTVMQGASNAD